MSHGRSGVCPSASRQNDAIKRTMCSLCLVDKHNPQLSYHKGWLLNFGVQLHNFHFHLSYHCLLWTDRNKQLLAEIPPAGFPADPLAGGWHRLRHGHPADQQDPGGVPRPYHEHLQRHALAQGTTRKPSESVVSESPLVFFKVLLSQPKSFVV